MDKLELAQKKRLEKIKSQMAKKKLAQEKNIEKKLIEKKNIIIKEEIKIKKKVKKVIVVKSELDVNLTKSELICIKHVLCQYIKDAHSKFRRQGSFYLNTTDKTEKYLYGIYSNVFKAYNKLSNKEENSPIFQTTLIKMQNENNNKN